MPKNFLFVICFLLVNYWGFAQSPSFKTYINPVIPGDHPDPTLTKIGNYFYTSGSSFNPTPKIYRSTNLVHWEVIAQPVSASWTGYGDSPGGGIWGGHMVFYNGKYWHFFGRGGGSMYFVTADQPEGPWSNPTVMSVPSSMPAGFGVDNSIFIDDDGKWYLLTKAGKGNNHIVELGNNGQATGVVYDLTWLNPPPTHPYDWAEGPVMWKYNGYYYYSFAQHLVGAQYVMRSSTLTDNQSAWTIIGTNIFTGSSSVYNRPNHISPAITLDDGTSWVVAHSYHNSNEWYAQGRQGLLCRVTYNAQGFPVIQYPSPNGVTAPNLPSSGIPWTVPKSDFFNSIKLNPEWSFLGYTPANTHSLTARSGWFTLWQKGKPNTIIKNCAEHNYSLITKLDFAPQSVNDQAGIWIFNGLQTLYAKLYCSIDASRNKIIVFSFKSTIYTVSNSAQSGDNILLLKLVRVNHQLTGYYSNDGYDWIQVGSSIDVSELDGLQSDYGAFTGNKQGLFVQGGNLVNFDYYIYRDAYTPILAECPANQFGTTPTSTMISGIRSLDNIHNNDWALYAGVEFGNDEYAKVPDSVTFIASCASSGGIIEVWLDSIDTGSKIAECNISNTGSWSTYRTFSAKVLQHVSGNHDVYLKFKGTGSDKLFILQWMSFKEKSVGYRSSQSGDWGDASTWEKFDGANWVYPAPRAPCMMDDQITIQSGHQVRVTQSDTVDQVYVQLGGTLLIESGATLVVNDGVGADLRADGVIINKGNLKKESLAIVRINSGGKYVHAQDGGEIPTLLWIDGSVCEINGVVSNLPQNAEQSYSNFIWNCAQQATDINMKWSDITIGADINVQNTGTGVWQLSNPSAGVSAVININGNFIQSDGKFSAHNSNEAGTSVIINQAGNVNIMGGEFNISGGTQGGNGTTRWNLTSGNLTVTNATIKSNNTANLGARFVFKKVGVQVLNIGMGNTIEELSLEVSNGTTLKMDSSQLTGNGHFILNSGATFEIRHADGIDGNIQVSGPKIFGKSANYIFNGGVAQVTGVLLPDSTGNITLDNNFGLTLSGNVVVKGMLEIKRGALQSGDKTLRYGPDGVLKYSGPNAQTTTNAEFPLVGAPKNLIINNIYGVTLHATRELGGNIDFQSGKFTVGANSITATTTSNAATTRYIVTTGGGKLKLRGVGSQQKLFPVGISTYAPVWITNAGAEDDIEVGVISETTPAPYGGRLNVKWNISEANVGGGAYTMQFGWTTVIENTAFKADRAGNAKIYIVPDTMEVGTGAYTTQFATLPYTVRRAGITQLGSFVVGKFSSSTSVEEYDNAIPTKFALSQNYPNPFNPTTRIKFELSASCHVSLKVYDLLGRVVATLVDEVRPAGKYDAQWEAIDFPSGIYLYRITTNYTSITKKMILAK